MAEAALVTVEFFGIPRRRAGRCELTVRAGTVAEMLHAVASECPGLNGLVQDGRLTPHYLIAVDGRRFVADLTHELRGGDRVILMSADAGG